MESCIVNYSYSKTNKNEDGLKIVHSESNIIPKSEKVAIEENADSITINKDVLDSNTKDKELESQDRSICTIKQYFKEKNKAKVILTIVQKRFKQLQHFIDTNKKIHKRWSKKHVLREFSKLSAQQHKFGGQQSFKEVYYCFLNKVSRSSTPNKPMRRYEPARHRRSRPRRYNKDESDYDYDDESNQIKTYNRSEPERKETTRDDILRAVLLLIACLVSYPCLICCICFTICGNAIGMLIQRYL